MEYTSDDYATANLALNAAFEDFAATIGGSGDYRICLAKDITLTTPLNPQPSVKKATHLHLNGYALKYLPSSANVNTSALTVNSAYFSSFNLYGTAKEDGVATIVNDGNKYMFSSTLAADAINVYGSYKGNFSITKMRPAYLSSNATFYGNVTTDDLSANSAFYVKGDLTVGAFWASSAVTVTGDFTCKGRTYPQGALSIGGNLYANTESGNGTTLKVNTSSSIIVGGDAYLNCKSGGTLFDNSAYTPKAFKVSGKTTLTGAPATVVFKNATLSKGVYNNTTNSAKIVLDETDIIGSVWCVDGEEYKIIETVYGQQITPPANPVKDGATFVRWEDENGEAVDTANLIQGLNCVYNAKFNQFTETEITITKENEKLPELNLTTEDNSKIIAFKDSKGNIVKAGSIGTVGETYTAITVKFNQLFGASMRISAVDDANGLRFLSTISKADVEAFETLGFSIVERGTKIGPAEYFADSTISEDNYAFVKSGGYYETTDTDYVLAGSVVRIKDKNLTREFIGQGYLKIKLADGEVVTITATLDNNKRSIYKVAGKAFNDKDTFTAKQLEIIKSYLNAVVIINKGMIETPEGYATPYVYTGKRIIPNTDLIDTTKGIKLAIIEGDMYYTDSEDRPIAAVVTDTPDAGDVTELTAIPLTINLPSGGTDKAGLLLPKTYTENGTPTRLIITCHGHNDGSHNLLWGYKKDANYFAHQGYAVLMVDGGAGGPYNMGNPTSVESTIAAYKYVKEYYNIYDEVFLKGNSMGGLSSTSVACSGEVPILAQVQDSPVLSLYRQGYCYGWTSDNVKWISSMYRFTYDKFNALKSTNYTQLTFPFSLKEKYVSDDERLLYQLNFASSIVPNSNIWKYCSQFYDMDKSEFKAGYEDYLSTTDDARIEEIYSTTVIDYPNPLKIYHSTGDGTVPYKYSKYFVDSCQRSATGAKVELKTYGGAQHCSLGNDTKVYCKDGSTMTVKDSFVDMLNYFKSFE